MASKRPQISCAFINIATLNQCPPENRGVGILSLDASYRCKGFGNFTDNRFELLYVGILNSWNDPLFANSVDGMHFDRNLVGIYDMVCTYSIVKNNRFTAMTSTTVTDDYLTMGMYIDQSAGYLVGTLFIQDAQGRVVFQQPVQMVNGRLSANIDVSDLSEGIYHVHLADERLWLAGAKFMVEH